MPWDPDQYRKFAAERSAPFDDLVALIRVRSGMTAIDLGCGTGELTERLAALLPESDVVGIDASAEMLAKATPRARPGLRFEHRAIEDVRGAYDLVFSHAALQWVDHHAALIRRLFALLRPGGQLAVQMPSNHGHVSHRLIVETAREEPFRTALAGWTRVVPVLSVDAYATILHDAGGVDITVFEKVYAHILPDAAAVVEWTRGTALVPYLERLPDDLREPFLSRYSARLAVKMPGTPIFYPFRRILFAATRPA